MTLIGDLLIVSVTALGVLGVQPDAADKGAGSALVYALYSGDEVRVNGGNFTGRLDKRLPKIN